MMYSLSDKELMDKRNQIFLKYGIPALSSNDFERSIFFDSWYGRDNLRDFTYEFSRLSTTGDLELLTVWINRGDKRISIFLNIFRLFPKLSTLQKLKGTSGIKFSLPPNSKHKMELRSDDYPGIPLFYLLFRPSHNIGCYFSKSGFERKVRKLERLISRDMKNIDYFVKRWHELHKPNLTDWEGTPL